MSSKATMKAAVMHKVGDPTTAEVISVDENVAVPEPGDGQVLVAVHAASVNPVDWKLLKGDFPGMKPGSVFGFDVSGTVTKIGPNTTTDLKEGDEVYADAGIGLGTFAEYAVVNAVALAKKPKNISMVQAAALPLAGLTAIQGLKNHGNFQEGQKVLIFGGSGGVGSLAIQMAKAMGASEIYSTGSNVDMIKGFGADVVVNYKEESLMDALKGKDFDLVYDTIGGYEHWEIGQAALRKNGAYITIAGDLDKSLPLFVGKIIWRKLSSLVLGTPSYHFFLTDTDKIVGESMQKITELVENGSVKPILDENQYELTTESVHAMIERSMTHRAKGKLVLKVI